MYIYESIWELYWNSQENGNELKMGGDDLEEEGLDDTCTIVGLGNEFLSEVYRFLERKDCDDHREDQAKECFQLVTDTITLYAFGFSKFPKGH